MWRLDRACYSTAGPCNTLPLKMMDNFWEIKEEDLKSWDEKH